MRARPAHLDDVDALLKLEQRAFSGDRFKRRQLRYLLSRANAYSLVIESEPSVSLGRGMLLGHGMLLFRRGSHQARLYSLCVDPAARGQGLGAQLLERLMNEARFRGCQWLILEVRADNQPALSLYAHHGFMPTDWLSNYYDDGCTAWRMACCLVGE